MADEESAEGQAARQAAADKAAAADKTSTGAKDTGRAPAPGDVLDLRNGGSQVDGGGQVELSRPADPYSLDWARVVKPVMAFLLSLLAIVMLLPFFMTFWIYPHTLKVDLPPGTTPEQFTAAMKSSLEALAQKRTDNMFDWAKTILPSVVGFVSAMVGYYFGTRGSDPGRGQRVADTTTNTRS